MDEQSQPIMNSAGELNRILQQAVEWHRAGRLPEAEAAYRQALTLDPRNSDAYNLLGLIAQAQGRSDEALFCFDQAIHALRRHASAYFNKAKLLADLGRNAEAVKAYRKAIDLQPDYADARLNLGALLRNQGNLKEAISVLRAMTSQHPTDARGYYNLGRVLAEAKEWALGEAALIKAVVLQPSFTDALLTLAKLFADTGRLPDAIATARKAVVSAPANSTAHANLGTYLSHMGDDKNAIIALDRAIECDPGNANARVNKGVINLSRGRLGEGWNDYAFRAQSDGDFKFRKLDLPWPRWNGEPLKDKRIFIWNEQGLGDEILHAGMIPEIAAEAEACLVACSPRLIGLFRRSMPGVEFLPLDEVLRDARRLTFDYQASALDLGRWRRRAFNAFPNRLSYLRSDPLQTAQFRRRYFESAKETDLLVGFSWRSFASHIGDLKSPPVEFWRPLFDAADIKLVSLQYGPVDVLEEDMAQFRRVCGYAPMIDLSVDTSGDFDPLAAQVGALDVLVTVSNTGAHLGGALGVPTWVFVPQGRAELWYWFRGRTYNPWYPVIRCIPQAGVKAADLLKFIGGMRF